MDTFLIFCVKRKLLLVNSLEWTALRNDDAKWIRYQLHNLRLKNSRYFHTTVDILLFAFSVPDEHNQLCRRKNIETNTSNSLGRSFNAIAFGRGGGKYILEIKLNDVFISIKIFIWHKSERSF